MGSPMADDPTSPPPRLSFSLPLDPARLLRARHRVRDFSYEHLTDAQAIDAVVLAIEEAMTNAVIRQRGPTTSSTSCSSSRAVIWSPR